MDMNLDITLDVNVARLAHMGWELELERLVLGGKTSTAPHVHANCDLRQWIYARGLLKYGQFPEMWELKEVHHKFHDVADEIVRLKLARQDERALEMLDEMRDLSRDILYLLTTLELSVMHHKQRESSLIKGWHVLGQFFGGDKEPQPLPMFLDQEELPWYAFRKKRLASLSSVLDINAARLNHVMWVRNLEMAFTRLNRGKIIHNADECSLGRWVHAIGYREFGDDPQFKELDTIHLKFHDSALKAIEALHRQDFVGADMLYKKTTEESKIIVLLLTHLEHKMQDSKIFTSRMKAIL